MGDNLKNGLIVLAGFAVLAAIVVGAGRLVFRSAEPPTPVASVEHAGPAAPAAERGEPPPEPTPAVKPPPPTPRPAAASAAPADPGASLIRSTVFLVFDGPDGEDTIRGSGFVIDRGIVVTNYELVTGTSLDPVSRSGESRRSPDAIVRSGGGKRYVPKDVLLADLSWDVAFLWVPDLEAPALALAGDTLPADGAPIVGPGAPHRLEARFKAGRVLGSRDVGGLRMLDVDLRITPLLRGAPLLDASARAVGMAVDDRSDPKSPGHAFSALDLARMLPMARANIPAK